MTRQVYDEMISRSVRNKDGGKNSPVTNQDRHDQPEKSLTLDCGSPIHICVLKENTINNYR